MSDKLEPCPFCGCASPVEGKLNPIKLKWRFIACPKCGARTRSSCDNERVIAAWNRRAFLAQRDEKVRAEAKAEAFEEAAKYHQDWADELKPQAKSDELPQQKNYFRIHERDAVMFRARAAALRKSEPVTEKSNG